MPNADEWLPILLKRLDDRAPRVVALRNYTNGNAPMPEMGRNAKESWQKFQQKSRTNWGELIVEALAERCVFSGVSVGGANSDDDRTRRIVRENRLQIAVGDLARDMFTASVGYIIVGKDARTGRPVVTAEKPEFVYAAVDPLMPWKARAAVKVWRDFDLRSDFAYVWANGERVKYWRRMTESDGRPITQASGDWSRVSSESYSGVLPVFVFENHDGTGEFETHTDLIDRINMDILQRLTTVSMQAFKQRALLGGLPTSTEDDDTDWAKVFEPAPGALWDLPPEITNIWESQDAAQGILAMLQAEKDDIRDLAAVSRTPVATLLPDAANQSAEGAAFAREGLVFKARDRIARLVVGLNEVIQAAIRVEDPSFDETVDVSFMPPEHVSLTEKSASAVQARAAGVPWRTVMLTIYGFPADVVDRMEQELATEALIGGLSGSGNSSTGDGNAAVVRPAGGAGAGTAQPVR